MRKEVEIGAVIFDFDGPIISHKGDENNFREVARRRGLKVPDNFDPRSYWGKNTRQIIKGVWPEENVEMFQCLWEEIEWETLELVIPTTKNMLKRLSNWGLVFGILTQRRKRGLMPLLERHGLINCFCPALIQTSDIWPHLKPDPQVFDYLFQKLANLGVAKEQMLYVGDTLIDFQSTGSTGIKFLGVQTGPVSREQWLEAGLDESCIIPDIGWLSWWLSRHTRIFFKDC